MNAIRSFESFLHIFHRATKDQFFFSRIPPGTYFFSHSEFDTSEYRKVKRIQTNASICSKSSDSSQLLAQPLWELLWENKKKQKELLTHNSTQLGFRSFVYFLSSAVRFEPIKKEKFAIDRDLNLFEFFAKKKSIFFTERLGKLASKAVS